MRSLTITSAVLLAIAAPSLGQLASVDMNAQINLGHTYNSQSPNGNAIYTAFNADTQTIFADGAEEPEGFTRHNLVAGAGGGSWWYQYVDLNLAGIATPGAGLNLSSPTAAVKFDTRYYQDVTNTNRYNDAPVFLRLYTYGADGNTYLGHRDYGIVYATQAPWNNPLYPTWTTVTVNVNTSSFTDGGTFDVKNVSRIRWYGTDWAGAAGMDFVDFKNLVITPEPASLVLLGLGSLLLRRRRA